MNKLFPTALGLKVAIAISAGGVLSNTRCTRTPPRVPTVTLPSPKPTTRRFHLRTRPGHRRPHEPLRRLVHRPPTFRLLLKLRPARKAKAHRLANLSIDKKKPWSREPGLLLRLLLGAPRERVGETGVDGTLIEKP